MKFSSLSAAFGVGRRTARALRDATHAWTVLALLATFMFPVAPAVARDTRPTGQHGKADAKGAADRNDEFQAPADEVQGAVASEYDSSKADAVASSFSSTGGITINNGPTAPTAATPYPSGITVSGLAGQVITDVNVRLTGLTEGRPGDLDFMLVSPTGVRATFLSDVGTTTTGVTNVDLVIDDEASGPAPTATALGSGTYQPTNTGPGDQFPAPAPNFSSQAALSTFDGTSANGTWALYVVDDSASGVAGSLGSWTLEIETTAAPTLPALSNKTPILIESGPTNTGTPVVTKANPYPSTIAVSGLAASVADVNVTLRGVYHAYPGDLDVVVVSPSGQAVALASDAIGSPDVVGATLTFDDEASGVLPPEGFASVGTGTYRPTNYAAGNDTDAMPGPAPAPETWQGALSAFDGTNPNGVWRLYVIDDFGADNGQITGGWTLDITACDGAPRAPTISAPASVCAGSTGNTATTSATGPYQWSISGGTFTSATNIQTVTYTAGASGSVTLNLTVGSAPCTAAASPASVAINPTPVISAPASACAGQTGVTATGSVAGTWTIANGAIDAGQGTNQITFHVTGASGVLTLGLTAGGCSGMASVGINGSPSFSQQPQDQTACLGATATFTAAASGNGTLTYQWYRGSTALADGAKYGGVTTGTLSVFDAGPADAGTDYNVVVTGCGSQTTSNLVTLTVDTSCFDSQFAAGSDPTRDWSNDVPGRNVWALDGTGNYATATASSSGLSSISHVGNYGSFDYRVDWVRTGTCATCPTSLYIRGVPQPVQPPYQRWFSCYQFSVTADGRYSVWLYNGTGAAVAVQAWTPLVGVAINAAPAANWLQVMIDPAQPTMMHFVVNGVEVAMVPTNGVLTSGQVGVSMMRNTTVPGGLAEVLKVDRARLGPHTQLPAKSGEESAGSATSHDDEAWSGYKRLSKKQRRRNREAQRAYELHPELGGTPDEPPALAPRTDETRGG